MTDEDREYIIQAVMDAVKEYTSIAEEIAYTAIRAYMDAVDVIEETRKHEAT